MQEKKKSIKNLLPILAGILGIAIILLSGSLSKKDESNSQDSKTNNEITLSSYSAELEAKIKNLCESSYGVSEVTVAVSFTGGFEYEYAKNYEYSDNSHGNDRSEEYLVIGQGSSAHCILLRQKLPEIAGVGVVCKGASDGNTKSELIYLISAMLGIGTNKIYISEAS